MRFPLVCSALAVLAFCGCRSELPVESTMSKDRVIYRGVQVTADWPAKIAEAQKMQTVRIAGVEHQRIRYGGEKADWGADREPCHDCAAIKGEFHVFGCDVERCPKCEGQLLSCECDIEEE